MPRLTAEDKELILADYHTGHYSVRDLAIKHRDKAGKTAIGNLVKDVEPKNRDNVDALIAIHTDLAEQSGQEVDSVSSLVDKKTEHLKMINDNATLLGKKLKIMAEQIDSPYDLKTLVDANDRLAITTKVADRHAPKIDITQQTAVMPTLQVYAPEKNDDL